jgi:hypothetical protein
VFLYEKRGDGQRQLFIIYCPYATVLGYERPIPHLFNRYQHPFGQTSGAWKLTSLTLYIDLWQEGKPTPGQNPPVISPPVVIFRRTGVALRFEPRALCYLIQG